MIVVPTSADDTRRRSRRRSSAWRFTISHRRRESSISHCCPTGPTARHETREQMTRRSSRSQPTASRGSMCGTGRVQRGPRFLLLHRRRVWSEGQKAWMGWERKRGKLHELNRLLRGASRHVVRQRRRTCRPACRPACATSSRSTLIRACRATPHAAWSASSRIRSIRRASIRRPDGSSRATRCCSRASRLRCPSGREGSIFQRVFSSASGIDPYAAAVSDVYQDLLGRGLLHRQGHLRCRCL